MTTFREQQEHMLMTEVARLYRDERQPVVEVAKTVGYPIGKIKRLLKEAGLSHAEKPPLDPHGFSALFAEGKTLTEAAAAAKTSLAVARYWADKLKVPVTRHRRVSPSLETKNSIVAALQAGEHAANVAVRFDVQKTTVHKLARIHNITLDRAPRLEYQIRFCLLDVLHVLARAGVDAEGSAAAMKGYSAETIRLLLSRPRPVVLHRQTEELENAPAAKTRLAA